MSLNVVIDLLKMKRTPFEVITRETIDKIHDIIMKERRVTVRDIAEIVGISTERVQYILHEELQMKQLFA